MSSVHDWRYRYRWACYIASVVTVANRIIGEKNKKSETLYTCMEIYAEFLVKIHEANIQSNVEIDRYMP